METTHLNTVEYWAQRRTWFDAETTHLNTVEYWAQRELEQRMQHDPALYAAYLDTMKTVRQVVGMNHSLLNFGARTNLSASDVDGVKCSIANLHHTVQRLAERDFGFEKHDRETRPMVAVRAPRWGNGRAPNPGGGQRERLRRMKQLGLIPKTLKLGA